MTINTLYELVRNSVEKFASKVAFSMFEGDDVTYAEVGRRIEKVQEILTGAGLRIHRATVEKAVLFRHIRPTARYIPLIVYYNIRNHYDTVPVQNRSSICNKE